MALDTSIITDAMAHIRANPGMATASQDAYLANAIKAFVEGASVVYTVGLVAPPGGGQVTGVSGMVIE